MVSSDEIVKIQNFLKSRLEQFTKGLKYSPELLKTLEEEQQFKKFADEVNFNLLKCFECLEDYKLITLLSVHNPSCKSGGQANAAVWNDDQDQMIQCSLTWNQVHFYLSLHLIQIPAQDEDEDDDEDEEDES